MTMDAIDRWGDLPNPLRARIESMCLVVALFALGIGVLIGLVITR